MLYIYDVVLLKFILLHDLFVLFRQNSMQLFIRFMP